MLTGKICIVTGGSRGIGKAISQLFADNGAIVYATATKENSIELWSKEFNTQAKGEIRAIYFDVSDESAVRKAVMQIKQECEHIDVLVNNAGVEFNELIGMIDPCNMKKMFDVNVYGIINTLQIVSRIMRRQKDGGSIVNITSMTALRGSAGQLAYSASKGAVISITKSAAKELTGKNIRVNAIAPGLTDTEMIKETDSEKLKKRIDNICMGRIAEPNDIAKACLFMASDLSSYVSGQVLAVDGCTVM